MAHPALQSLSLFGRAAVCGAFLVCVVCARAQTADLIYHDGFDGCWSRALTESAFLTLIQSSIENATPGCIPAGSVGGTPYCTGTTCPGDIEGCPIKIHSGPFYVFQLDATSVAAGFGEFNTTAGSFDSFSMPVTIPIIGDCILTFTNTDPASLLYLLTYPLRADGTQGFYTTGIPVESGFIINGLTANDVSLTGGLSCSIANPGNSFYLSTLTSVLQTQLDTEIPQATVDTVGQSVCPLVNP